MIWTSTLDPVPVDDATVSYFHQLEPSVVMSPGFGASAAHFSRLYAARFGMPPARRRQAMRKRP